MKLVELSSLMAARVFAGLAGQLSNPSNQQVQALAKTATSASIAIEAEVRKISKLATRDVGTPTR